MAEYIAHLMNTNESGEMVEVRMKAKGQSNAEARARKALGKGYQLVACARIKNGKPVSPLKAKPKRVVTLATPGAKPATKAKPKAAAKATTTKFVTPVTQDILHSMGLPTPKKEEESNG